MAEGGTFRDSWDGSKKGVTRFVKKVWFWGHNDQRASWIMHIMVCVAVSLAATGVAYLVGGRDQVLNHVYAIASIVMMVFYGLRELGDARAHRKKKDWNKIDKDTNWQGKQKLGVSAAYDGWADFLGPFAHCLGACFGAWL